MVTKVFVTRGNIFYSVLKQLYLICIYLSTLKIIFVWLRCYLTVPLSGCAAVWLRFYLVALLFACAADWLSWCLVALLLGCAAWLRASTILPWCTHFSLSLLFLYTIDFLKVLTTIINSSVIN